MRNPTSHPTHPFQAAPNANPQTYKSAAVSALSPKINHPANSETPNTISKGTYRQSELPVTSQIVNTAVTRTPIAANSQGKYRIDRIIA
jgi:hypothetical protein